MLEGLAAWVLNSFLGEYVENLNTDQLSIGVVSGQVELENLPLRKDALRHLDLPLEVKSGFIGCIKLVVPWRHLKSQAWVITLEKLYLVAGPVTMRDYDEEKEKKTEQERKQAQLKALESMWKVEKDAGQSGSYSWWSYGTSMATNILENLQLEVKDIHIRYEDDQTLPDKPFACGVTIKNLSAKSTDKYWIPQFVSQQVTDMMHKLVDLQDFALYWDTDAALAVPACTDDFTMADLEDILKRGMAVSSSSGKFKDHTFMLEPVSAKALMKRNTTPLPLRGPKAEPRITLDIQLESLPVALVQDQYTSMVAWTNEFRRYDRGRHYRRWRPHCGVKEGTHSWWQFAISATLHFIQDRNKRCTKSFMLNRARTNTDYVDVYSAQLTMGERNLDINQKTRIDEIEEELEFEDLKILRKIAYERCHEELEEQAEAISAATSTSPGEENVQASQGRGMLQGWFSGWGGWYGSAQAPQGTEMEEAMDRGTDTDASTEESGEPPTKVMKSDIDQEIMDVLGDSKENNTLLRRDTVFVKLNFGLKFSTFRLLSDAHNEETESKVLLELECSTIQVDLESRPRNHGLKFGVSVGGFFLRDKMTPNSILPTLVSPQQKDNSNTSTRRLLGGGVLGGIGHIRDNASYMKPVGSLTTHLGAPVSEEMLFELVYDKNPLHSKADYRLCIKTQPLDIVYNPQAISKVKEFFAMEGRVGMSSKLSQIDLLRTAQDRYEDFKEQTKAELKQTWDTLMEADSTIRAKRWDFQVDISTPQIILPESFVDHKGMLVVFDLGRLQFQTVAADLQPQDNHSDDSFNGDDNFVTPSSTPPEEEEVMDSSKKEMDPKLIELIASEPSENALHEKIYDKYKLSLLELQVMVGQTKDNWKHIHQRSTSQLHVVDKFSISMQFERRLFYTSDPKWPKNTLSGTLPSLTLHVNEQKIKALQMCTDMLSDSSTSEDMVSRPAQTSGQSDSQEKTSANYPKLVSHQQDSVAEALLMLMQFSINQVSLEIQSRGRSVVELQVAGVKATFTQKLSEMSAGFTVHSMLVVDAVQTFGPDFELLVASHKNLCLDRQSGSIRDSGPNSPRDSLASPTSPVSPNSPAEPSQPSPPGGMKTSIQTIQNALQSWISNTTDVSPSSSMKFSRKSTHSPDSQSGLQLNLPLASLPDSEALIKIELDMISPNWSTGSSKEAVNIANIQFNNLDFIANQETLVELLTFLQCVSPSNKAAKKKKVPTATLR